MAYFGRQLDVGSPKPLHYGIHGRIRDKTDLEPYSVTTSINFSGGQLILSAITLWKEDFVPNTWQTVLMFWAVMTVAALVNIFMSRYLDQINKICMIWTSAAVIIILVTLLATVDNKRSAEFVVSYWTQSGDSRFQAASSNLPCCRLRANITMADLLTPVLSFLLIVYSLRCVCKRLG